MKHGLTLLMLIGSIAFADPSAQETLSPLALLNRCYAHFTQMRLPPNHPQRLFVEAGGSAVTACLAIFDSAVLQSSGSSEGMLATDSSEGRAVLRTFNELHRNWFPSDSFTQIGGARSSLHDTGESALHVTRTLFTPGVAFSQIVTGTSAIEALRTEGPIANSSQTQPFMRAGDTAIDTELVQRGALLGVRPISLNPGKANALTATTNTAFPGDFLVNTTYGGGLIGTPTFLMLNWGLDENQRMNGGLRMPRDFSRAIYRDLLCRDLPVIRLADAAPYVQTTITAQTPEFRKTTSCMGCHASIDPLGALVRNFVRIQTAAANGTGSAAQMYRHTPDLPRESGMVDSDNNFHRRPPSGRLFYRDYKGDLKLHLIEGVGQLGDRIAASEDLYVCAASRYFHFMTGIRVNLQDPGDPSNQPLNAIQQEYRALVVGLGLRLKSHQSLRTLVNDILELPIYSTYSIRSGNDDEGGRQ